MISSSLVSLGILDPQSLITGAGIWGLAIVCAAVFAETGLLIGFFLPGDTLLFFTGVLTLSGAIRQPLWLVVLVVAVSAALGDQLGYTIGRRTGPRVFERRESGIFSKKSVDRTEAFFTRFGPVAVTIARFVPVVRTFAPVAAGVGHMSRRLFTLFNLAGAALWSGLVILVGFGLAHVPGVTAFVSQYIDIVLIGIVVISVVPIAVRTIIIRRRTVTASPESD
ncbi:VTT domain-containing protein [soil metagenome]